MPYSLRITDLPTSERPRERLLTFGAKNLATAELIAILLGTGQGKGKLSAVGLGQHILQELSKYKRDPLDVLRDIHPHELMTIPGIGPAKATTILSAIELGKRVFQFRPNEHALIESPDDAAAALNYELMWERKERFVVLLLDVKNALIGTELISVGTATETLVNPPDVFREAIRNDISKIVVGHNHPSGNLTPSPNDLTLTERLLQCGQLLNISVLDHLILGNGSHESLRQTTTLWNKFPQGD